MTMHALLATDLDAATAALFDAFVAASPFAAYQQTRAWTAIVPRGRRQDYMMFLLRDDEAIVAAAIVRRTLLGAGTWLATSQRGPIVHTPEAMAIALPALKAALLAQGACSVQLSPRVRGRALPPIADALRTHGFVPLPAVRQSLHSRTGIVWLDKPEADILAGFKQRGRRQLKAAGKAGVTVRPARGARDIATYQALLDAFRAARPDYDMSGQPDAAGQAALIARLGGALLLAERDGVAIGGHAFVRQADEAIWLSLATSDDYPEIPRSYPLLWHGMRLAREMGCIGYDLAGMPQAEPRDAGEANRMQFKTAFDPTPRIMPPMQIAALRPVRHMLLFGARQIYRDARKLRRAAIARSRRAIAHG